MKRLLGTLLLLMVLLTPALSQAARPLTRPQILVWDHAAPTELRRALRAYADSAAQGDSQARLDAGEALQFLGNSYERDGLPDSALVAYRRAVALRGNRQERLAYVDLLLTRGTAEAVREARGAMVDELSQALGEPPSVLAHLHARNAWVLARDGQPDSALSAVTDGALPLAREPQWAKRFARIALDAGREDLAWRIALPAAVRSRGTDTVAMELLRRSATTGGPTMDAPGVVAREVAKRDTNDTRLRFALGARRVIVRTADRFPLTVTFVPALATSRPRVALLIAQPGDTLAAFDSLVVQMARGGIAVAILDPRGARGSVAASAPGTDAALGHERAWLERTARDARETLDALVRLKLVAPSRAMIGATGAVALAAARAAELDARFAAVMLVAPAPAPVDRGALRAALARSQARLFVQVAPEDVETMLFADRLAESLPIQQTRVADTGLGGRGAAIFRADPKAVGRVLSWWKDVPLRRPAPPPARPR